MFFKALVVFLLMTLSLSCSVFKGRIIGVQYDDRQTLAFTGKGLAAGIMLDSVLGGAGIAIGIAIDEGIAKDIAKSIYTSNPEHDFLVDVKRGIQQSKEITIKDKRLLTKVVVIRHGFRTTSGEKALEYKDAVSPWISLSFNCTGSTIAINYPEDIGQPVISELQDIKVNGQLAADQLKIAVGQTIDHWLALGGCATPK